MTWHLSLFALFDSWELPLSSLSCCPAPGGSLCDVASRTRTGAGAGAGAGAGGDADADADAAYPKQNWLV
jgi:hypothetical protein